MALALTLLAAVSVPAGASSVPELPKIEVIVRAVPGSLDGVREKVGQLGGEIVLDLGIINGLSARLTSYAAQLLGQTEGVLSVTPDYPVRLNGAGPGGPTPVGNLKRINSVVIRSDTFWKAGYVGDGIGVALIDSGVTAVGGLDGAGKIWNGPDLSFDSPYPNLGHLDMYGHGTHVAGIIAGQDPSGAADGFAGVAPGAHIVNVKVADATGTADVSQVIAGIGWVVAHADDPGVNIRVLNLAFGTDGTQDYRVDPLAYAAEAAWHAGIVVVVAAGNDGLAHPLRNPAYDPYVISVGAVDAAGTFGTGDDSVLDFSNCGTEARSVDLLAPGRSVSSLRVPGSYVDANFPGATDGTRFLRGTGTSQAAAVVSGAVALVLQHRPDLSPDQVKALLLASAQPLPPKADRCMGAGNLDLHRAFKMKVPDAAGQEFDASDGSGSLEAARGSYHVLHDGVPLVGEIDITGGTWSGGTWSGGTWSGGTWSGGTWSGGTWSGGTWSGGTWSGGTWSGGTWSGGTWSGGTWSGGTWSGGTWSGGTWSGGTWSGGTWSGGTWSGGTWSGGTWSGGTWSGGMWSGVTWG
jgi:serine protease AprX